MALGSRVYRAVQKVSLFQGLGGRALVLAKPAPFPPSNTRRGSQIACYGILGLLATKSMLELARPLTNDTRSDQAPLKSPRNKAARGP